MKQDQIYRIISKNSKFATRYFAFKYHKLAVISTYRINIDADQLIKNITELYPDLKLEFRRCKSFSAFRRPTWKESDEYVFCDIKNELVMQYEANEITLCHSSNIESEELQKLSDAFLKSKAKRKKTRNKFSMINKEHYGFALTEFKIKKFKNNISENYNDDLVAATPDIMKFLNSKSNSGIILLHGVPGGGKTSYIRTLISECDARFIFVPNNLFTYISNPEFIQFISSYPNSVIILEDCEELLKSREHNQSGTGISNLLNLGDGLLGDALKLKIICTFNSALGKIDEALLRKGRLMYRYEFGPLEPKKANGLLEKLELDKRVTEPVTLAEVFNFSHDNNSTVEKKKVIGFAG